MAMPQPPGNRPIDAQPIKYLGFVQFAVLVSLLPYILTSSLLTFFPSASPFLTPFDIIPINVHEPDAAQNWFPDLDLGLDEQLDRFVLAFRLAIQLLLYPVAAFLCCLSRQWKWLLFGLAVPNASVIAFILAGFSLDPDSWRMFDAYLIVPASKVAFLWFAISGRLASRSFAIFLGLPCLFALLSLFGGNGTFRVMTQIFYPYLSLVLAVLAVRFVLLAVRQNFYFFKEVGARKMARLSLKSALYWAPLLLLAVPYFYVSSQIEAAMEEAVYDQSFMVPRDSHNRNMQVDLQNSTAVFYQQRSDNWSNKVRDFEADLEVRKVDIRNLSIEAGKLFDDMVPNTIPMTPPDFDGFLIGDAQNLVVEKSQENILEAYQYVRSYVRQKVVDKVDAREGDLINGATSLQDAAKSLRPIVTDAIVEANSETQWAIISAFMYYNAAAFIAHLLFAFACIRSYMYVFGRVAFAPDAGAYISLASAEQSTGAAMPGGVITKRGHEYTLPDSVGGTYFFARRFQPHGRPPKFAIPQPIKAPIARLVHGAMAMNQIDMREGGGKIYFTATGGAEFVEWDVAENEIVVFDFTNFVGMSQSITISTLISLRVATLLLGKIIFSAAQGPGKLVLMTKGRPRAGNDEETSASLPPNRLVAWQQNIRFHAESELNLVDMYLSTSYVKKLGAGSIIADIDKQDHFGSGLARFIRHFLWPA